MAVRKSMKLIAPITKCKLRMTKSKPVSELFIDSAITCIIDSTASTIQPNKRIRFYLMTALRWYVNVYAANNRYSTCVVPLVVRFSRGVHNS